jgi:quercetin dioxygenase-like cupin family protein
VRENADYESTFDKHAKKSSGGEIMFASSRQWRSMVRVSVVTVVIASFAGGFPLTTPALSQTGDIPDALSVEWQGKHLCENLYEDVNIRVLRCTFPPGAVHVKHYHPAAFGYVLEGGKGQVVDANGTRQVESKADAFWAGDPIPWHEYTNTGDTTERFLAVEKKY